METTKETVSNKGILNLASTAGLALGAVSSAYMLVTNSLAEWISSAAAVSVINVILWVAKFVGCIWLMKWFMQLLVRKFDGVNNRHTLRLGLWSAFFSALLFAAANLAYMVYIAPEAVKEAFDTVMSVYAPMLDSNSIKAITEMKDSFPAISFFSNLIYCFLYGFVLSSILARRIPSIDPFAEFRQQQNYGMTAVEEENETEEEDADTSAEDGKVEDEKEEAVEAEDEKTEDEKTEDGNIGTGI